MRLKLLLTSWERHNELGTGQSSEELTELGSETLYSHSQNLISSTLCIVGLPQQCWEPNVLPIRMKCNEMDCSNYRDTALVKISTTCEINYLGESTIIWKQ